MAGQQRILTVDVPASDLAHWRKVMQAENPAEYAEYGHRGTVVFCATVSCDAVVADIRVVTSITDGEPPWCECVLFEPGSDGTLHEVACTDVSDDLEGDWHAEVNRVNYIIRVSPAVP